MRTTKISVAAVVVGAVVALAVFAYGNGNHAGGEAAAKSSPSIFATARANLARDYAGTDRALPKSGPKATKRKSVWVISCSSAAPGCAIPAAGAMEAGKAIGWTMKLADGKFDPSVYNAQVRAAIAAKADAIVLDVVDCAAVQGPLKAARAAGIKVYGLYSLDCDDRYGGGGAKLFNGALLYDHGESYAAYMEKDYSKAIADYVLAAKGAGAKIIELKETDAAIVHHINDGFDAEIAKCSACKVYRTTFTGQDLIGGKLQATTSALLNQHPDANVVMAPYDATILLGVGAAVQQAKAQGRKLLLTGGEGLPPNIKLITSGLETFAPGAPARWVGWASIDGLNRVFAGKPQVDPGLGHSMITAKRNLPKGANGYDGNARSKGYAANYRRIWGVK